MAGPVGGINPKGYQQITALSSAVSLTVPEGAIRALIQCETQDVRWRDDGTDPTGAIGMLLKVNTVLEYDGRLDKLRFIEAAASAKLNVSYYGV